MNHENHTGVYFECIPGQLTVDEHDDMQMAPLAPFAFSEEDIERLRRQAPLFHIKLPSEDQLEDLAIAGAGGDY